MTKGVFSHFFIIYKNEWENRDVILNRAKDYYENDIERLKDQAREKYRILSEEEKNKKREFGKNRYHSMSEEKKQKLKKYIETTAVRPKIKISVFDIFFFSLYKKWNKKLLILVKMVLLKVLF